MFCYTGNQPVDLPTTIAAAAATAATTTESTTATATSIHFFSLATSPAIRAPSGRRETFLLEESLLTLGENVAAAAIATGQGLIGHPTALLF